MIGSGDGLGKIRSRSVLIVWKLVEQGLTVLAVRAGEAVWIFYLFSRLSSLFFLTARYRLRYCLKESFDP